VFFGLEKLKYPRSTKNFEAKRSENIFRLCEANRSEQFLKIAKNCEKLQNCEKFF
jgi:hypothetical protein